MKQQRLNNRNDVAAVLLEMIRPLKQFYSPGHGWLHVGNTGVHYGEKASRMEGFARILWGLGPLWARMDGLEEGLKKEAEEWLAWYLEGIIHGTDPENEEYWGKVNDYDQKMVEMAALVTAVSLSPEKLWEPLTDSQKNNVYQFLNQINQQEVHPNNWRYFRILVNMTFRLLGLPWSEQCMEKDWEVIENCYTGDGWYYDGNSGQVDYYIPFAMHFYGLIYAKMMEKTDPEYCCILKQRSAEFSGDFVYWFSNDGNEIPYGRSLTYRFAHSAFFGALAYAEAEGIDYGVMKHIVLKNLETWLKRPIFDNAGVLTIGYGYPNIFMSERYNGPGSPYWGFKVFIMLALPDSHPFWTSQEKEYEFEPQKLLSHPHMLVCHQENEHVLAYTAGQHCRNHGHCPEKYEKFVYSNQFGFSVSREPGLREGAFDCTLAVSLADDENYRMRYGVDAFEVNERAVKAQYDLMKGVKAVSVVIPCGAWHVRVHRIQTLYEIDLIDGGFSIEAEPNFQVVSGDTSGKYTRDQIQEKEHGIFAVLPWGISGTVSLSGGRGEIIDCAPNTNLLYNLTILPVIRQRLEPGEHVVITGVFGDRSENSVEKMERVPEVNVDSDRITVCFDGKMVEESFRIENQKQ